MVGEHSYCAEGYDASRTGAMRRENVGMSNRKADEKSAPRKPKVSSATEIGGGLGGPKQMAKAECDGQLVNIPALRYLRDGATKEKSLSALMVWRSW